MRRLKGLWFLGSGLFLLVVWEYLFWQLHLAMGREDATTGNPLQISLFFLEMAGDALLHPSVVSIWPATMFTLITIGLYRLVRSLLPSHNDEGEEEE